jgi:hypothetical protein
VCLSYSCILIVSARTKYEETWIALNWEMSLPTPETHPSFPLWSKGFTPQAVYDQFFPSDFRFLCNPRRSAVCGRFGRPNDRLWRFEFVVQPGEDANAMCETAALEQIVYPYLTHAGSRYGWVATVSFVIKVVLIKSVSQSPRQRGVPTRLHQDPASASL